MLDLLLTLQRVSLHIELSGGGGAEHKAVSRTQMTKKKLEFIVSLKYANIKDNIITNRKLVHVQNLDTHRGKGSSITIYQLI